MYRANILFKNYKIHGAGDRCIIFLTCFIQKCLEQILRFPQQDVATRIVGQIVADPKAGDIANNTFFMNKLGLLKATNAPAEKTKCTNQLKKMMEECAKRLLEYLYRGPEGDLNRKFWLGLGKKPFLGQKFVDKQYQN